MRTSSWVRRTMNVSVGAITCTRDTCATQMLAEEFTKAKNVQLNSKQGSASTVQGMGWTNKPCCWNLAWLVVPWYRRAGQMCTFKFRETYTNNSKFHNLAQRICKYSELDESVKEEGQPGIMILLEVFQPLQQHASDSFVLANGQLCSARFLPTHTTGNPEGEQACMLLLLTVFEAHQHNGHCSPHVYMFGKHTYMSVFYAHIDSY